MSNENMSIKDYLKDRLRKGFDVAVAIIVSLMIVGGLLMMILSIAFKSIEIFYIFATILFLGLIMLFVFAIYLDYDEWKKKKQGKGEK